MPPTTRTRAQRAARRDEIRHRLLEAAERLTARTGESFTELTVDRLVKEADISRSTFYVYFEDKARLLEALADEVITEIIAAAEAWWQLPDTATPGDLRDAMQVIVETYLRHRVVMDAVAEVAGYDPRVRDQYAALVDRARSDVRAHIEAGQAAGSVAPSLDPEWTAAWLTLMTERGLGRAVAPADDARRERLVTSLSAIVWNTLYAGTR